MIVRRGLVAAALCAAVGVAGCTGGGADPPPTTTTVVPATTTTAAKPTFAVPTLPAQAEQPNSKGADAFFRYFFEVYGHAYLTLNASELEAISGKNCVFCKSAITHIKDAKTAGNTIEKGHVTVTVAVAAPGDATKALMVNAVVDQEEVRTRTAAGAISSTVPATKGNRVDAVVRWHNGSWTMLEVQVLKRPS